MTSQRVSLTNLIAPHFYGLHHDVQEHRYTHYKLPGGRGSTKSSFVGVETPLLMKKHPQVHAAVFSRYAARVKDTTFKKYCWALRELGIMHEFIPRLSPFELIYKPTGQRIMFRGADTPDITKSLATEFGYVGITHFEEKDQFDGREHIRQMLQATMRGGELFWNFETNNPPISKTNWANEDLETTRDDILVCHSDYRTVPRQWLGEQFFIEAEELAKENPRAYRHEYLGEATGTGANVFENVVLEEVSDEEIASYDRIYNGVDWGWYPDPWAFNRVQWFPAQRKLVIFDEARALRTSNGETAGIALTKMGSTDETVVCDSSEPKSIGDWRDAGIKAQAAEKGAGSVIYSYKWLQSLAQIVIDPKRCPYTAREFSHMEYERDKLGEVQKSIPDKDNHNIDAVRYATERIWKRLPTVKAMRGGI